MGARLDQAKLAKFSKKTRFKQGLMGENLEIQPAAPNRMEMD